MGEEGGGGEGRWKGGGRCKMEFKVERGMGGGGGVGYMLCVVVSYLLTNRHNIKTASQAVFTTMTRGGNDSSARLCLTTHQLTEALMGALRRPWV